MLDNSSEVLPVASPSDPLTDVLRGLRLDGVEYGRCRMSEPWGYLFPAQADARFHFVAEKGCWLLVSGGEWVALRQGDAVLMPRGISHVLASTPGSTSRLFPRWECRAVADNIFDFRSGRESEDACVLFCGSMRFNMDAQHPLLRMMPEIMRAHELMANEPTVLHLLSAMTVEVEMKRIGSCGILARLADVLAAQIIRAWVERGCGEAAGWVAAMRNPDIGRVLAAIHGEPEQDWTVSALASLMGASRSSFAEKFTAIVGETPARYVAQVRMHQARRWLSLDRIRVSEAARRLGYDSEASFSRAFKRVVGAPPGRFRTRTARTRGVGPCVGTETSEFDGR